MVLLGRIELPTSALPRMRSTTELQQHTISACLAHGKAGVGRGALWRRGPCLSSKACPACPRAAHSARMTDQTSKPGDKPAPTREERLAQRLRENLRLRKAQARALGAAEPPAQS